MKKLLSAILSLAMCFGLSSIAFAENQSQELTYEEASAKVNLVVSHLNEQYNQSFDITLREDLGRNFTVSDVKEIETELTNIALFAQKEQQATNTIGGWVPIDQAPVLYGDFDVVAYRSKSQLIYPYDDKPSIYQVVLNCSAEFTLNQDKDRDPNAWISAVEDATIKGSNVDTWTGDGAIKISYASNRKSVSISQKGECDHWSDLWHGSFYLNPSFTFTVSNIRG